MGNKYHPELKEMADMPQVAFDSRLIQPIVKGGAFFNKVKVANIQLPAGFRLRKFQLEYNGRSFLCYCVEPEEVSKALPAILYFHGGGFLLPLQTVMFEKAVHFSKQLNCRVFLPEYTLTTEEPFPTALNEALTSLQFIMGHYAFLKINPDKILLYGESAGGCLAASLVRLYLDQTGAKPLAGMALIYPVLDQAKNYPSLSEHESSPFSAKPNESMWDMYLDIDLDQHPLKEYAIPGQNRNFTNFPPVYIEAAEKDILRDEARAYGARLKEAGLWVQMEVVEGAYHAYDNDHSSPLVQRMMEKRVGILSQFLENTKEKV